MTDAPPADEMAPADYLRAARVPESLKPQTFGLWTIERLHAPDVGLSRTAFIKLNGWCSQTVLRRATMAKLHLDEAGQDIVMEDSARELSRHLPIWLQAHGRVLITGLGLGLGCVVRGLLASSQVEHIDVIEIDQHIIDAIAPEFEKQRVTIHRGDALSHPIGVHDYWDFAWHDLWVDDGSLDVLHTRLINRYHKAVGRQGAWQFQRPWKRIYHREWGMPLLGGGRR